MINLKTHAKDYLLEFCKQGQDHWLKFLIIEAVNTNGKITDEKLNEIYDYLKKDI